jgi:hypothetical protein
MPEVIPTAGDTALIIIDMQYLDAHPDFGLAKKARDAGRFEILNHLFARLRGWDLSTGWPTSEKLRELSLEKEMKSFYPG